MSILQKHILHKYFYEIEFSQISSAANNILTFSFLFFLPVVIVNYVLIFRNDRYKMLARKYPYHDGKYFLAYFLLTMIAPFLVIVVGMFLAR